MNPIQQTLDQLLNQEKEIIKHHNYQTAQMRKELFFGFDFEDTAQFQKAINIFADTMVFMQIASAVPCLYFIYNKKYKPGFTLFALVIAFGQPNSYLLRKNREVAKRLDTLQQQTAQSLRKLQLRKVALQKSKNSVSFWQSIKNKFTK